MFDDNDDVLNLDASPELLAASRMLEKAGMDVAEDILPLKKLEATCALRCFERIKDVWSMTKSDRETVMSCIEKCEEPMEAIGELIEDERSKMLESATRCLEQCGADDENCASACISGSPTQDRINTMLQRVRSRIHNYRYSF